MKKIHILLIILSIFSSNLIIAQNLKYDNIIEYVKTKDYEKAYSLLFQFQQTDPEFSNTYFQLGNISFYWAKNSDPLVDLQQTEYHIKNTNLFYSLCISKLKADEKDAKKNDKYYKTIPEFASIKKLENSIILNYIDTQMSKIEEYDKNAHKTAEYFNLMVKKYNETVDVFLTIIEKYDKLKDINLEQKSSILESTNDLILSFDSTLLYFEQYKISLKNYPIKNYNQELKIIPINTYKIQGISRTNFLLDTIKIWDYKSWAKEIQNNLGTDISHFRQTIIQANKELSDKEKEISNIKKFSNSYKTYEIDQKILFEIEKYDYNSIITDLFLYRKANIDYILHTKRIYNDTTNYSITPDNRAIEYYTLTRLKIKSDSLLENFHKKINEQNYLKHKDFFDFNYNNYAGLEEYYNTETSSSTNIYNKCLKNFKYFTYRDVFKITAKIPKIEYKNEKISLTKTYTEPILAEEKKYYTTDIAELKTGEKYITGFFKTNSGSSAFIAKIKNNEIEWLKKPTTGANIFEYGAKITANPDGCMLIIHTFYNGTHKNSIIKFDNSGKQIYKKAISNPYLPRYVDYDEINEKVLIAFQGNKLDEFAPSGDSLYLEKIDITSNKTEWKQQIFFDANFINIIKLDRTYYLIANYHRIAFGEENFLNSKYNIIIFNFSLEGKYLKSEELITNHFLWGICAYKINSETINIVGYNKKIDTKNQSFRNLPQLYYVTIDKRNKIIFQNL